MRLALMLQGRCASVCRDVIIISKSKRASSTEALARTALCALAVLVEGKELARA